MARVRYSLAEARAEATRRSAAFVAARPDRDEWRHFSTRPDPMAAPGRASKHPVAWIAWFAPVPPEGGVIDGGELRVAVDLEFGTVALWTYY